MLTEQTRPIRRRPQNTNQTKTIQEVQTKLKTLIAQYQNTLGEFLSQQDQNSLARITETKQKPRSTETE